MMHRLALLALFAAGDVAAQADGNPHGWDRKRRCDHTDYSPKCGGCEGAGGIPFGDKNDQIHLTSCEVVSADPKTLTPAPVKPVWGTSFTARDVSEVLIGPKNDPFCFNAFPSNSSVGALCYRFDKGTQTVDWKAGDNANGMYIDTTLTSPPFGKIQSKILHQGPSMWIVNHFPWYALGIHQCVCVDVKQGGDPSTPAVYPVQYNWTDQMFFIAREKIGVEYINADGSLDVQTLDHWAFGPHHVWSKPGSGEIIRMYQPFNGLQVFPHGNTNTTVDPAPFRDIPPPLCKKGGATFRINCDDNGRPKPKTAKKATNQLADAKPATAGELVRAKNMPGKAYRGDSFADMSNTLNKWLAAHPAFANGAAAGTKPCEAMTAKELQQLQAMLYLARDADLDAIYQGNQDNRRLRHSIDDLVARWGDLGDALAESGDADAAAIHRDGHCHEAVMWWVHHVSEDMKMVLSSTPITIPLLPQASHGAACAGLLAGGDGVGKRVCAQYQEQVTCQSCHSNVLPPAHGFLRAL